MIFVIEERSYELSLRGNPRAASAYDQALQEREITLAGLSRRIRIKVGNADQARNVAQAGCWRGWDQTEERSNGNSDRDGP